MKVFGLSTNYVSFGSGETVLFLHGWGCDVSDFLGSAKVLSKERKVVCLDLWGFGKSQSPKKVWNSFDYAKAVHEFARLLGIKKFHLVGHSFGGKIAIIYASHFSAEVKSLTLVASAGMKKRFSLKRYLKIKRYKRLKKLVLENKKDESVLLGFGSQDLKNSTGIMKDIMLNVVNENVCFESKKICTKTLIVWGKNDKETPIYMAKKLHKNIHHSKLITFDGGHFVHIENFLKFNETLKNFWEEV